MSSISVYISGPIAGKPDGNRAAFDAECRWMLKLLHWDYVKGVPIRFNPINPHTIDPWEHEGECPEGYATANGHSSACFLRADLQDMLQADALLMLEGWGNSKGANLERDVAKMCGIPVFHSRAEFFAYYNITEQSEEKARLQRDLRPTIGDYMSRSNAGLHGKEKNL